MPTTRTSKPNTGMKRAADRAAAWVITVAGIAVIAAMGAMLVLIVREAAPLFLPAERVELGAAALPDGVRISDVAALGVEADLHGRTMVAGYILRDGGYGFAGLSGGAASMAARLPGAPEGARVAAVSPHGGNVYSVAWDNGVVGRYAMTAALAADGARPAFALQLAAKLEPRAGQPLFAMLHGDEASHHAVAVYPDGTVTETALRPGKGLLARGKGVASTRTARLERGGRPLSAALNADGKLYVGTDAGAIVSFDFAAGAGKPVAGEAASAFRDRRAVTSLAFLTGGYAVAVGDERGGVSVWFPRRENGAFRFRRSVAWTESGAGVAALAASGRDRGVLTLDGAGGIRWLYSTTGAELLRIGAPPSPPVALAVNERADALATLHRDGRIHFHALDAGHPEAGWAGFFSKLLYEGYDKPAFVWQSTGSDASEPKLSLAPLLWGSVKAAFYALLFAAPLALAAAVYLSQFAHPLWRARLKPAVEMAAAVPSVVVGFVAALWLAPLLERHLGFLAAGHQYDQRNALVIAIAMGFAVIPTIFSLAEDAVSAVPPALSAASLALGASKWQTVWRVVLPSASPGIFTAVMLGLGRAVGETMIVLMAAGNTPIMSLSPFNGMRTLSANIAVEMPEAPIDGTLYRTLFLCALLLFALTLIINTAAELFRHRLRRRYGRL